MYSACIDSINKAAGRELSDQELDTLLTDLQKRQKYFAAKEASGNLQQAALMAADEIGRDAKLNALIQKRNAAINLKKRVEVISYVKEQFGGLPAEGLESVLVGVNRAKSGSRWSAAAQQRELEGKYIGGLLTDIEKAGGTKLLASGELDKPVARALWAISKGEEISGAPEVIAIAKALNKWQEASRLDANKAGASIGKLEGYIVRQSHDIGKIRRAGQDAWKAKIANLLDVDRTFKDVADPDKYLNGVYEGLSTGIHLKATPEPTGFKGPGNLAKRISQERVLHFKDADAWLEYNQEFGTGNLREAALQGLTRQANNIGLMRVLGTNPEANFNMIFDDILSSLSGDQKRTFADSRKMLENRMAEITGATRIPGNQMLAAVAANARAVETMAKLGGAVLSSITDIPAYASEMRYQGRNGLSAMSEAITGLLKGRGSDEQQEILRSLGVYFDSMSGGIVDRFSANDTLGGKMSRLQQLYFKVNGLAWWTETHQASAAMSMSANLAFHKGKSFSALNPELQRVLSLYGIDDGKWEILRSGSVRKAGGKDYMVPEAINDIPDSKFSAYLKSKNIKPSEYSISELRQEIESQFRAYITDRTTFAVIEPDAKTRSIMQQGTQKGTVEGELLRFMGQFKSFSVAFVQKAIGRELYGRGYSGKGGIAAALRNGNGEALGLANLMLWTTIFGYGAVTVKDLIKNKTPRDITSYKTWQQAMLQGGGLGIYGDFLLGEMSKSQGRAFTQTVAGPVLGAVDEVFDIKTRIQQGDDASAMAFKTALNHIPFMNVFYTRAAMDHLFLYNIQEQMNPGFLSRSEQKMRQDYGQEFLINPH